MPNDRIALVIGNAAYLYATTLETPVSDANAMEEALLRLNFDVRTKVDCDINDFQNELDKFSERIVGASVALFYYSGHALQHGGDNYLIPVDTRLEGAGGLERLTFRVTPQLEEMRTKAAVSLMFLDACRDDPFKLEQRGRVAGTKQVIIEPAGLAAIPKTKLQDAFIAFATEQGQTAADGEEGLSPFTKALIEHIGTPDLKISDMILEVKKSVWDATKGKQRPWSNDSLTCPFYFRPTDRVTQPLVKAKQDVGDAVNPGGKKPCEPDKDIGVAKRLEDIEESQAAIVQEMPSDRSPPPSSAAAASLEAVPDGSVGPNHIDAKLASRVTHLRITRSKTAAAAVVPDASVRPTKRKKKPARSATDVPTDVFQFSALSEIAVVPQREQMINSYLFNETVNRLTKFDPGMFNRERQGYLFTDLAFPDDFRRFIEGPDSVTLELDETTAVYPWEMAAYRSPAQAGRFFGINAEVSRQFSKVPSPPPTSPPALNHAINALVIADPAAGEAALPGARIEACAVVEMLKGAQDVWGGQYTVKATVRVSSCDDPDTHLLRELRNNSKFTIVQSADCCDPVELITLLKYDQYDLIHYAGHGVCDPVTGDNGWLLAPNYVLSAKDIFRVGQVPRLVFANACFSRVTWDHSEQRKYMATMARAFFGRGIPNYIGTGWAVDDVSAVECVRWFYARLMGLRSPNPEDGLAASQSEATIGTALRDARSAALRVSPQSSSWGAYQHYGHVNDRLVSPSKLDVARYSATTSAMAAEASTFQVRAAPPVSFDGYEKEQTFADNASVTRFDPDDQKLVVVNGINFRTGYYAFAPRSIDDIARQVRKRSGDRSFGAPHGDKARSFAPPFGMMPNLDKAGWAIIIPAGTPEPVRSALKPLIEHRRTQAGRLLKELDYNGEQVRVWLAKQGVSSGNMKPAKLPYYVLLVGSPEQIPFEFQYLLGVEYAVGRLSFDDATEYARYVSSTIAYESGASVPNAKQISYWGTRHRADAATKLSSTFLIDPLANGVPSDEDQGQPINKLVSYSQQIFLGKDATKANLLSTLQAAKPPALLFTASHGLAFDLGDAQQSASQGALLCQDWPGFNEIKPEHFLSAADVPDDANVNGMVVFLFACYGAGTPDKDQFVSNLSEAGTAPPPAAKPFIAALPQRLLAHPKGGALAVIGHIDRAWSFSMQATNVSDPQIETFRSSLALILTGTPVGQAMSERFGARYGELSTLLLNATSPITTALLRSDEELVSAWIERNDAQNYVLLGDPAVRIRYELLPD